MSFSYEVLEWKVHQLWWGGNTFVSFSTKQCKHTNVPTRRALWHEPPWPVRASQSHWSTRDDSWTTVAVMLHQFRNRYEKYSYQLQPRRSSSININSCCLLGSICLSLHKTIKRPCDMMVITYWSFGEHPQFCPLDPAVQFPSTPL